MMTSYSARQRSEKDANKHQFVSTTGDNLMGLWEARLSWTFFAADEIKVTSSKILQRHDLALVDPYAGRCKNSSFETMVSFLNPQASFCMLTPLLQVIPDMAKEVTFKRET